MVLDAIRNEEEFPQIKDFLINSGIIHYPLSSEDKEELSKIDDPNEFAFKFMEIGIIQWFLLTRGE